MKVRRRRPRRSTRSRSRMQSHEWRLSRSPADRASGSAATESAYGAGSASANTYLALPKNAPRLSPAVSTETTVMCTPETTFGRRQRRTGSCAFVSSGTIRFSTAHFAGIFSCLTTSRQSSSDSWVLQCRLVHMMTPCQPRPRSTYRTTTSETRTSVGCAVAGTDTARSTATIKVFTVRALMRECRPEREPSRATPLHQWYSARPSLASPPLSGTDERIGLADSALRGPSAMSATDAPPGVVGSRVEVELDSEGADHPLDEVVSAGWKPLTASTKAKTA